mmetsp:Transcript_25315/g.53975  ORF Transcript_25315/g.53975 Transcript_25315/m.53975 type:complete len:783 (+) Transcript_25315:120-2468(+)|eukprot:CAMPEP_0201254916 /NCGR_PEP_ID=MMETSP0852-20130820/68206_1 /ASSEMBLY_ACC=CAM_ASM_000632 /TAXON_ID=183588 /ORGANISM="Pseudo-nitzschia fraudulenta, Strain WWA7" /LENGTH=782 /DNA_ID=CAMNT_0047554739 /DNA_START=74 /DNA_END=2422 /DNA_ORIENTATION=-
MAKKSSARSVEEEEEEDQVMNGADDSNESNGEDDHDVDNGYVGDEMGEADGEVNNNNKRQRNTPPASSRKRSRRKRGRSPGPTGLTPPRTKAKRSRNSVAAEAATEKFVGVALNGETKPSPVAGTDSGSETIAKADSRNGTAGSSPAMAPDPRRISYSEHAPSQVLDQQDESPSKEDAEVLDLVPPKLAAHTNGKSQNDSTVAVKERPLIVEAEEEKQFVGDQIPKEEAPRDITSTLTVMPKLQRLLIITVLGFISIVTTIPRVVTLSEYVVPLKDTSILPPPPKIPIIQPVLDPADYEEEEDDDEEEIEEEEEVEEISGPSEALLAWNKQFSADFQELNTAKTGYQSSVEDLENYHNQLLGRLHEISEHVLPQHEQIKERMNRLNRLEAFLKNIEQNGEASHDLGQAKELAQQLFGKTILTTSSIPLWEVPEGKDVDCGLGEEVQNEFGDSLAEIEELKRGLLSAKRLEEEGSLLAQRSRTTAEEFIGGPNAESRIREWVKSLIAQAIADDHDAEEVIKEIEDFSKVLSAPLEKAMEVEDVDDSFDALDLKLSKIIESRLDIHRADVTGMYDHASLKNGAQIIYGGKRGTSKSLIDCLPMVNRILQSSRLRFYGFGPEAALTATYPPNTLGQCWSFRETPLKEQLKDRLVFESDNDVPNDFKRGNFGTLTIQLPYPTVVESVIIEHPPYHMTEQLGSAIRSFRVVGYEDEMASTRAWNLGSFEYSLRDNRDNNLFLQEFETATTVFGKEIPRLHSISLAVDSNYGNDYACLYRFRIHGTED